MKTGLVEVLDCGSTDALPHVQFVGVLIHRSVLRAVLSLHLFDETLLWVSPASDPIHNPRFGSYRGGIGRVVEALVEDVFHRSVTIAQVSQSNRLHTPDPGHNPDPSSYQNHHCSHKAGGKGLAP